jgi:hypothetical protein
MVQRLYESYLGRPADPVGLSAFTAELGSGGTDEAVAAALVGSPEFFQDSGGSNSGFLSALYEDVLNRPIAATGQSAWGTALKQGVTRAQVASANFASTEYE